MAIAVSMILVLLLFIIAVYLEVRKFLINRQLKNFALVKGAPIIGVIGRILGTENYDIVDLAFKFFDETKSSSIRFWIGPVLVLGIYDPASVEIVLTKESALNKPFIYKYFHCDTSLIVADKELWKPNRRALNSAFIMSKLLNYLLQFNENSHLLIKRMQSHLNEPGDMFCTISVCFMNLTFKTMFDVNVDLDLKHLCEAEKKIVKSIQYRIPQIWFRNECIYYNLSKVGRQERRLMKYFSDIIEQICVEKVEELKLRENTDPSVHNFLEKCLQLEQQGIFSHKNVLDELRIILVGAQDTVSITIFGTLLMLAINQRHQELVVSELRAIFESADCDVTQTHLAAMNYTERVIKESMRLLPPVPFIARRATADIILPNGTVPKDTNIFISIMHMHRNPQIWGDNVLEFDPDRFLPENIEKRPPFSYIPFSAGSRNCIGMKYGMMAMKTMLAHLLRQYKFTTDLKFDEIKLFMHIVLDIGNENPLRIQERKF